MEENKLDDMPVPKSSIEAVLETEGFSKLSEKNQKAVLDNFSNTANKEGGLLGKIFGNKKENAAMNIAFTICLLLVLVGIICMASGNECWNIIITGIMTIAGYIFGRGTKD